MNKNEIRDMAKNIRASILPEQRVLDTAALTDNILDYLNGRFLSPDIIGLYHPVGSEISPLGIVSQTRRFALPVIHPEDHMDFYEWNVDAPLVKQGNLGILGPNSNKISPIIPDIIFVPLLICDMHGHRIGYGKGYYDRYLASLNTMPLLIGICFDEQIHNGALPAEPHDVKLNGLITPKRMIKLT